MKRNAFLMSALGVATFPFFAGAKANPKIQGPRGFRIPAGEGRLHGHIKLKGVNANVIDTKIAGGDTAGNMAMFEQTSLSQGMGTPLHVHHRQDEVFYVLEGSYYFQVGEDKFRLERGDSIFLPMKLPHAWTQVSATGKMIVTFQPAGKMENFFVTLAAMEKPPAKEEMAKLFADNEMQIVGPPLSLDGMK